jgi:hypothetical protein
MDLVSSVLRLRAAPNHPVRRALRRAKSVIPYSFVEGAVARLLWLQNAGIRGRWPHVDARAASGTPGVNVFGFLNRPLGLGEAARSSLRALDAARVPACGVAFDEEDLWRPAPARRGQAAAPHCVNLCHVNAPEAGFLVRAFGSGAFRGRFNIGYWFWELAALPAAWDVAFGYFDEIWVASSHVQKAVAARAPVPDKTGRRASGYPGTVRRFCACSTPPAPPAERTPLAPSARSRRHLKAARRASSS